MTTNMSRPRLGAITYRGLLQWDTSRSDEKAAIETAIRTVDRKLEKRTFNRPRWEVWAHHVGGSEIFVAFHDPTSSTCFGSSAAELAERVQKEFDAK